MTDEEVRALQMDSDEAGGYLVAPQRFVNQLIKALDDMVFIRQLATKQQLNQAQSLGVPSLDADPADADSLLTLQSIGPASMVILLFLLMNSLASTSLQPSLLRKGSPVNRS